MFKYQFLKYCEEHRTPENVFWGHTAPVKNMTPNEEYPISWWLLVTLQFLPSVKPDTTKSGGLPVPHEGGAVEVTVKHPIMCYSFPLFSSFHKTPFFLTE